MKVAASRAAKGPSAAKVDETLAKTPLPPTSPPLVICSSSLRRQQRLTRAANLLLWLAIVSIHAASGCYYAFVALVYHKLPSTILSAHVRSWHLSMDLCHFPFIVAFHVVCVIVHAVCLFEMVAMSARRRRLYFHRGVKRSPALVAEHQRPRRASALSNSLNSIGKTATRVWDSTFGITGLLGVGSKHFALLFLLRESVEAVLQSVQAYQLSEYVPRMWLNRLAVAVVAVSCWSTPAIRRLMSQSPRLELLLCLLFDVALDFVASIIVPGLLAIHYFRDYDPETEDFKTLLWPDTVWYVNMNNELKQVFMQSWLDFASRALFAATLMLCLDDVKFLAMASEGVVCRVATGKRSRSRAAKWSGRLEAFVHSGLIIWGFVIVALHLASAHSGSSSKVVGCQVQVRPWLTTQLACTYLSVDCQQHPGMVGNAAELEAVWHDLDRRTLRLLVFRNCPALHMPAGIRAFKEMTAIFVYSSTVVEWSETAALSKRFHPNLRQLLLKGSNLAASAAEGSYLPPGLVDKDFPPTVGAVVIIGCALGGLPANLHEIWPPGINMMLLAAALPTIPKTLLLMQPVRLSLQANQLQELPAALFEIPTLKWLQIGINPISELPQDVRAPSTALLELDFSATNVSALPPWMLTRAFQSRVKVTGTQTPFCAKLVVDQAAESVERASRVCRVT